MKTIIAIKGAYKNHLMIITGILMIVLFCPKQVKASDGYNVFEDHAKEQQNALLPRTQFFGAPIDIGAQSQSGDPSFPFLRSNNSFGDSPGTLLRLDGIDEDDNALGEEVTPVGNGIYILLFLSMLFMLYRFWQTRKLLHELKYSKR